jgi:hypothetical protein
MLYQKMPSFNLTASEKVMLQAFIQGTQVTEKDNKDPVWTNEALDGLQDILDGQTSDIPSHLAQDLFCIFTDLIIRKELGRGNVDFTKIMAKFMHYLVYLIDWTIPKKKNRPRGAKTMPQMSISIPRANDQPTEEPIPHDENH